MYAFLTPQIPDENTRPIIYSQNILKKIVYSKISCDNTEFSSELEKRDLTEAFKNSLFLKKHSNPEVQSPCWSRTQQFHIRSIQYSYMAQKGVTYSHCNQPWRTTTKQKLNLHLLKYGPRHLILWALSLCPCIMRNYFTLMALLCWVRQMFSLYWKAHAQVTADGTRFYRLLNSPACSSKSHCQYTLSAYCLNMKSIYRRKKNLINLLDPTSPFPIRCQDMKLYFGMWSPIMPPPG